MSSLSYGVRRLPNNPHTAHQGKSCYKKLSNIQMDPDQEPHFVGHDLGPNCLQRLLGDHKSKERLK